MPRSIIDWEIMDAFSKFGFDDGDGPNFTNEVVAAIEAAGPYRCRTQTWGLHNYAIEAIEEQVEPEKWEAVAEFDGYKLPAWERLPNAIRDALVALNNGGALAWHPERSTSGSRRESRLAPASGLHIVP